MISFHIFYIYFKIAIHVCERIRSATLVFLFLKAARNMNKKYFTGAFIMLTKQSFLYCYVKNTFGKLDITFNITIKIIFNVLKFITSDLLLCVNIFN